MEFCPTCGTLLQYELSGVGRRQSRFFCPTCPYVCSMENRVKIIKRQHLVQKVLDKEPRSEEDQNKAKQKTDGISCEKCNNGEAYFEQHQTRSADEASTLFYECTKCGHRWALNP